MTNSLSQLEQLNARGAVVNIYSPTFFGTYGAKEGWDVKVTISNSESKFEVSVRNPDLTSAIDEAYRKMLFALDAIRDLDPNRTIEHQPPSDVPIADDDIPF